MMVLKNQDLNSRLFDELVPNSGKADSLAGEMVRAYNRLVYRYFNDGDRINYYEGKSTCNAPARFLLANLSNEKELHGILDSLWDNDYMPENEYETKLLDFCDRMALYINAHPELREKPTADMLDYKQPDDEEYSYEEENW